MIVYTLKALFEMEQLIADRADFRGLDLAEET
jgi:hypothetical protein